MKKFKKLKGMVEVEDPLQLGGGGGGDYYPLSSMVLVLFFQEKYKIVTSN